MGTGRSAAIQSFLEVLATKKEAPPDWYCAHNFRDLYCPTALKLAAGMGQGAQKDMEEIAEAVKSGDFHIYPVSTY